MKIVMGQGKNTKRNVQINMIRIFTSLLTET